MIQLVPIGFSSEMTKCWKGHIILERGRNKKRKIEWEKQGNTVWESGIDID